MPARGVTGDAGRVDAPELREGPEHERHELRVPLETPRGSRRLARAEEVEAAVHGNPARERLFLAPRVALAADGGVSDGASRAPRRNAGRRARANAARRRAGVKSARGKLRRHRRAHHPDVAPGRRGEAHLLAREAIELRLRGRLRFRHRDIYAPSRRARVLRHGAQRRPEPASQRTRAFLYHRRGRSRDRHLERALERPPVCRFRRKEPRSNPVRQQPFCSNLRAFLKTRDRK